MTKKYIVSEALLQGLVALAFQMGTSEYGERGAELNLVLYPLGPQVGGADPLVQIALQTPDGAIELVASMDGDGVMVERENCEDEFDAAWTQRLVEDLESIHITRYTR